jgi:hypothetical protein
VLLAYHHARGVTNGAIANNNHSRTNKGRVITVAYDKDRLILSVPNIPYGDPSLIGDSEWKRLAQEFPASYKEAQRQIKAHEEAHPPKQDGQAAKPAPKKSAAKKPGQNASKKAAAATPVVVEQAVETPDTNISGEGK